MKKKIFKFFLPIACCSLFSMTVFAAPKAPVKVEKQESTLTVSDEKGTVIYTAPYKQEIKYTNQKTKCRTGPSSKYKVSSKIKANRKVVVVGKIKKGKWSIVETKKGYFFIYSKRLVSNTVASKKIYTPKHFKRAGVIKWGGWRWTWYSQKVLPGGGLKIPGRHVNKDGYVCDKDGYICLASGKLKKGTVVKTPFGAKGKVYDSGCARGTLDVYCNF